MKSFLLFFSFILIASSAIASDSTSTIYFLQARITFENDFFAQQDRYYTVGMKLSALFETTPSRSVLLRFPIIDDINKNHFLAFSIAQQIFTPLDQKSTEIVKDDRPYAGWLYTSAAIFQTDPKSMDALELQLGVVGPSAKGKEVMFFFHDLFGNTKPNGWDNQLNDEFGIVLAYERKWRFLVSERSPGANFEIIPHAGFSLGNIHTYVNTGGQIRYGWNLPSDYGISLIRPAGESSLPYIQKEQGDLLHHWSFYIFGLVDTRLVGRNIFLDGNTFSESHRVEKIPIVADMSLGFVYQYKRFYLSYTYTLHSKEFVKQPDPHQFVSLSLSWLF